MASTTVTMQDIAARCGVTQATVSRALRGEPSISAATTARVQACAAELGYDPEQHGAARRMALRRHGQVLANRVVGGVFPTRISELRYFAEMFEGISEALMEADHALLACCWREGAEPAAVLPGIFYRGEVDGLIVAAMPGDLPGMLAALRRCPGFGNLPIVTLMRSTPGFPSVETDDTQGGYAAARHLLELGHRRLLQLVLPRAEETVARRLVGVRRAFAEYGLELDGHLTQFTVPWVWVQPSTLLRDLTLAHATTWAADPTRQQLVAHLRAQPQITALLARNDAIAIRAWDAARAAGRSVPADLSIVGYDDTDAQLDEQGLNLLTSVRLPLVEAGRQAARLVMRLAAGETDLPERIELPAELVVRASTA